MPPMTWDGAQRRTRRLAKSTVVSSWKNRSRRLVLFMCGSRLVVPLGVRGSKARLKLKRYWQPLPLHHCLSTRPGLALPLPR